MQISAFVDGELPDSEADLLFRRMSQDPELRREAAQFLELGRVMRGDAAVHGMERLRERIAAALDDNVVAAQEMSGAGPAGKAMRPLLGAAAAAAVAVIALFGLQLTPVQDGSGPPEDRVANAAEDGAYTVPQQIDEQLRQYYLSHGASSSEMGANGMNARLVTLRLSEETLVEVESEEDAETDDAPAESTTQP